MTDLIARPRRLRKSPALRAMFEETTLTLNDLVLPIFVEEEIDDYKAIEAMPGVMRIPEKYLAREIERIANAGIRSVMTFGISHHTDATGSDAWKEDGLVARMSRICKETVPEMIRYQRLARNLEQLRQEGERIFSAPNPEARRQALFVVRAQLGDPAAK